MRGRFRGEGERPEDLQPQFRAADRRLLQPIVRLLLFMVERFLGRQVAPPDERRRQVMAERRLVGAQPRGQLDELDRLGDVRPGEHHGERHSRVVRARFPPPPGEMGEGLAGVVESLRAHELLPGLLPRGVEREVVLPQMPGELLAKFAVMRMPLVQKVTAKCGCAAFR